jgi:DNA-dependent RNA polymerase auxiliary subunit epsilon
VLKDKKLSRHPFRELTIAFILIVANSMILFKLEIGKYQIFRSRFVSDALIDYTTREQHFSVCSLKAVRIGAKKRLS